MLPENRVLATRFASDPNWSLLGGMVIYTSHDVGGIGVFPVPAGSPIRLESENSFGDMVQTGYWGEITRELPWRNPLFQASLDQQDKDIEEAYKRTLPDVEDPATLGAIRALVRSVWDEPLLHTIPTLGGGWRVVGFMNQRDDSISASGATEAEAWLLALEAASKLACKTDTE